MGGTEMPGSGGGSLGSTLEPVLSEEIRQQGAALGPIQWFRSEWQRGGGSTGLTTYTGPDGVARPAVVKLPVGPVELEWTVRACAAGGDHCPTPRVYASGTSVGGYDLAWLVMERLEGPPLAAKLDAEGVRQIVAAAARFQQVAEVAGAGVERTPAAPPDFERLVDLSRQVVKRGDGIADGQRWNNELKAVHKALGVLTARWSRRAINTWCHGDLHGGNAMRRADGTCVLIDLALVHPGHWVEDALYLERVLWGRPGVVDGTSTVSLLAAARRERGLACDGDYGLLANIRRVLSAACAPALFEREGNPRYLAHALELIHRLLPQVAH
jgi:aminoglycoside phosphotransferase (APT) family kinase protein